MLEDPTLASRVAASGTEHNVAPPLLCPYLQKVGTTPRRLYAELGELTMGL
jgi:hypothetical protein